MDYSTGGRGNQAPYDTTHVRIPVPIKELVQAASKYYRETLFLPTLNVVTPLVTGDDDDQEDDNRSDPSDLETIQSQAQMIQAYVSEIHYLKHKLDELNELNSLPSLEDAKQTAKYIINVSKKPANWSVAKLLADIYQVDVTIDDLK